MKLLNQDYDYKKDDVIPKGIPFFKIRVGLALTIFGFLIFLLGARPSLFGLDRSPVIGFVQIGVFLFGLAIMCVGGHMCMMALWNKEKPSILADIGLRLVATGFVIAVFAGMADVFGFGSHPLPDVPYFGGWQTRGVEIGQAIIAIGFLFMVPYRQKPKDPYND